MKISRKVSLFYSAILSAFLLYGCGSGKFAFSEIPENSIYKANLKNGNSVYLVNNLKSEQLLLGNYFYDEGSAYTDAFPFSSDDKGNVLLHTHSVPVSSKIKGNKKELSINLDKKIGKAKFYYAGKVPSKQDYKERYAEKIFSGINSLKDVEYGRDKGFYTSYPIVQVPNRTMKNLSSQFFETIGRSMKSKNELPLLMDIYEPKGDSNQKRPVILYIHGGAFYFGDKENTLQQAFKDEFVEKGYVVVSMNYRLGTNIMEGTKAIEKAIYTGVQDMHSALRYLIRNQNKLRIDPEQIYLAGNSAGGIIACATTYMDRDEIFASVHQDWKNYGPIDPADDKLDEKFRPAGLISMWGAMVDPAIIANDPPTPTLLFHGTEDDLVNPGKGLPFKNFFQNYLNHRAGKVVTSAVNSFLLSNWTMYGSESIYQYMQSNNLPVEYIPFRGYEHEPQENEDGSFNENMTILEKEMSRFLGNNVLNHYFDQKIDGRLPVLFSDPKPVYSLSNLGNNKVDWLVEGGFITEQGKDFIQVIWFKNIPGIKKVIAYITNARGETAKKEFVVY